VSLNVRDDLCARLAHERKTLRSLRDEAAWLRTFSFAHRDETYRALRDATDRLIVQAQRRIRILARDLDDYDQFGEGPEPVTKVLPPTLPVPVVEDDGAQPATHLLEWEQEKRASGSILHAYASIGRSRSRRYEGFHGSRIRL